MPCRLLVGSVNAKAVPAIATEAIKARTAAKPLHRPLAVNAPHIDRIDVTAYTIPTDAPESDSTIEWRATTVILVRAHAGRHHGLGYSYADAAAADVVGRVLAPVVQDQSAMDTA